MEQQPPNSKISFLEDEKAMIQFACVHLPELTKQVIRLAWMSIPQSERSLDEIQKVANHHINNALNDLTLNHPLIIEQKKLDPSDKSGGE